MTDREGIQPLLPCPFCDGSQVETLFDMAYCNYSVGCSCGASGPSCQTKDQAIAAWNRRAGGSTQEGLRIAAEIAREKRDEWARSLHWKMEHLDPTDCGEWEGLTEHEKDFYRIAAEWLQGDIAQAIEAAAAKGRKP